MPTRASLKDGQNRAANVISAIKSLMIVCGDSIQPTVVVVGRGPYCGKVDYCGKIQLSKHCTICWTTMLAKLCLVSTQ